MLNILVVEDDPVSREVLCKLLSKHGECSRAEDGLNGLEKVEEALEAGEPFDLICLDLLMPSMGGHEALKKIRQVEAKHGLEYGLGAKIVVITALSDPGTIMEVLSDQCDSYITKPVEAANVERQLRVLGLI